MIRLVTSIFISDLHLCEEATDSSRLFFQFLEQLPAETQALYILGDLFESWIGDDDDSAFNLRVMAGLRSLNERNIQLYYQRGNRDFLYGDAFAGKTQGLLLDDECVIDINGERVLVLHGDQLCTDDTAYQQFRALVRSSKWRGEFLLKPLAERRAIAQDMRNKSRMAQQNKAAAIMDINTEALAAAVQKHGVHQVIHGHTHRPARHEHELQSGLVVRHVLGDWHDSARILRADCNGVHADTIRL